MIERQSGTDFLHVRGSLGVDSIEVSGSSESFTVAGLNPLTRVRRTHPNDQLLMAPGWAPIRS